MSEYEQVSFEERVKRARQAMIDLYLDDPNPDSAQMLMLLEQTVRRLREERRKAQKDA